MRRSVDFDDDVYELMQKVAKRERRTIQGLLRFLLDTHPHLVSYRLQYAQEKANEQA